MKNFVPHTRPVTKKEIQKTIIGLKKQIGYLKSIGHEDRYYADELIENKG